MHHQAWSLGLKTGMYYLRSQSKSKAKQFSEGAKKNKRQKMKVTLLEEHPLAPVENIEAQLLEEMTCEMKVMNGIKCYSCT